MKDSLCVDDFAKGYASVLMIMVKAIPGFDDLVKSDFLV